MNKQAYPEKVPSSSETPMTNFMFSLDVSLEAAKQTQELKAKYDKAMDEILDSVVISGFPILKQILMLTRDPDDLQLISDGLGRLVKVISGHDELVKRQDILEYAKANPEWFAFAFADVTASMDSDLEKLYDKETGV